MIQTTLGNTEVRAGEPGGPSAWQQQTVGAFFARCNWENLPIALLEQSLAPPRPIVLGYHLSVGAFFAAIPWQGGSRAAAPGLSGAVLPGDADSSDPSNGLGPDAPEVYELPELDEIADESPPDWGNVTLDDFLGNFGDAF